MNKNLKENDGEISAKITKESGIKVRATYLFGFEGESKDEMKETMKFAKKLDTSFIQLGIITPFPGTPYFEQIKNKLNTHDWRRFTVCHQFIDYNFDIEKELSKLFLEFHLRPGYLWKSLKEDLNKSWTIKTLIYPILKLISGNKYDYLYPFKPNEWMKKSEDYWQKFILKNNITFEKNWYSNKPKVDVLS